MTGSARWIVALAVLSFALSDPIVLGESWSSRLQDGRPIKVNPSTNKVTVFSREGLATPLWDGVHRLEDGSTITVRSGVMVPNREVLDLRRRPRSETAVEVTQEDAAPCRLLVRKVCGLTDECADSAPCGPARQLLRMREQETRGGVSAPHMERPMLTLRQCQEALLDEAFFAPCAGQASAAKKPTACQRLRNKVCGTTNQCSDGPGCGPATQLLELETQERYASVNPDSPTFSSGQCLEALQDEGFFAPCGR